MTDKTSDKKNIQVTAKFNLIELLSILLMVGLLFVFIVPVQQAKVSRNHVTEAVSTMQMIAGKAEEFKVNPENGYYPDISQLNLGQQIASEYFDYAIGSDDSTVVAETKPAFGKKGAFLVYNMSTRQYRIGKNESDVQSVKYINENWLP
jgi:Tfp pilus assembly protein PilE